MKPIDSQDVSCCARPMQPAAILQGVETLSHRRADALLPSIAQKFVEGVFVSSYVWACHRAYKLYRCPGQAGSALVTAEDAAAACEELARATRRSSPSGKASRAATRADRAAEGAAQLNCSLMICMPEILHNNSLTWMLS